MEFKHVSVLMEEVLTGLNVRSGGLYLDATLGGGGHSRQILEQVSDTQVVGIDQDEWAIAAAQERLQAYTGHWSPGDRLGDTTQGDAKNCSTSDAEFHVGLHLRAPRITFWHGNFAEYDPGNIQFDGILADLGVSSAQLDIPERGFSFRHDAPLDMRMNGEQELTAADIVNHWDEKQLADVIYQYGEERLSRRIARRIVERRPLHTTTQLADTVWHSVPRSYRYGKIHPATRTFQALRIAVNRELEVLTEFLCTAPTWLRPGGRLVIISFHSLEDRLVKHTFRQSPYLRVLSKKPIVPTDEECMTNPRARSAKLRVAEAVLPENS